MAAAIIGAIITAVATLAAASLQYWLSHRKPHETPLSFDKARAAIVGRARDLGMMLTGEVLAESTSSFGTEAFVARQGDDKNAFYFHTTGPCRGKVKRVQGGIGWYYLKRMGGSASLLGLPVSDEYDVKGGRRSDFEGGRIVWNRERDFLAVFNRSGVEIAQFKF
jgi:uncharacterized protein with LGFP repeats